MELSLKSTRAHSAMAARTAFLRRTLSPLFRRQTTMLVLLVLMGLYFDSGHSREYLDNIDLLPTSPAKAAAADGQYPVINGYKDYTQLHVGNLNIFISVPHGGSLMPSTISNRTNDAIGNMKQDFNTQAFGEVLRSEIRNLFLAKNGLDVQPFLLYNQLHR